MFAPGSLVDLGTGHGGYAMLAARLGWKVTAVDARAERWPDPLPPEVDWVQADMREVDLGQFDLILCLGIFYHLTAADQVDFLRRCAGRPIIIDTQLAHGTPEHRPSDPVEHLGYTGRLYREPGKLTSSWGNDESFWPTLESFHRMLNDCGYPVVLTAEPWVKSSRGIFVALP